VAARKLALEGFADEEIRLYMTEAVLGVNAEHKFGHDRLHQLAPLPGKLRPLTVVCSLGGVRLT
jgi:hypothetical protein